MCISRNFSLTPNGMWYAIFSIANIVQKDKKSSHCTFVPSPFFKICICICPRLFLLFKVGNHGNSRTKKKVFLFLLLMHFSSWRSPFSRHSSTVASLAVLWPKEIMCCSWRWVVVAPNPKDFGLFLAQEVLTMQPKMEMSSHLREPEVFREQHPLCLPGEGKYYLFLWFHALLLHFLLYEFDCPKCIYDINVTSLILF